MKRTVIYCRVSTREQGDSRLGLDAQEADAKAFAQAHGYEVLAVHREVASGALGVDARPQLAAAIGTAKKHKATVLVSRLDRLSREVSFIAGLMSRGVPFVVAALGEGVDPFTLHIFAAVAENERKTIGLRTRAALAQLKAQGVTLGGPKVHEAGALGRAVLQGQAEAYARTLGPTFKRMQGAGMSANAIARELNQLRTPTPRGGQWTARSVLNVFARLTQ